MTALAEETDSSPNLLLAAAGWDELPGKSVALGAGETLPVHGQTVWFPLSSVVRVEVGPGRLLGGWVDHQGAIGLNGETESSSGLNWIVSAPGSAFLVESAFVDALMDRAHRFTRAACDWLQGAACEARHLAASNATDTAAQRIASFLLAMDSHGRSGEFFAMNQDEIARLTAVQRTTACGVMLRLKRCGVIGYARSRVRVLDRHRLIAIAKF
jgi:Crp-like helix-turn-helix domain